MAMTISSKPPRKLATLSGPIMDTVRKRSSLLDSFSAAETTDAIHPSSMNSSTDGRPSGTGARSPPVLYGDPVTAGWEDLVPSSMVHPSACASTSMVNGTRAMANPNSFEGWRASSTIFSVSKLASGQ